MDWLAQMLNLPKFFLASEKGLGGGVIQGTASEATLVSILSAKNKKISEMKKQNSEFSENEIRSKLVMYCSEQVTLTMIKQLGLTTIKLEILLTKRLILVLKEPL